MSKQPLDAHLDADICGAGESKEEIRQTVSRLTDEEVRTRFVKVEGGLICVLCLRSMNINKAPSQQLAELRTHVSEKCGIMGESFDVTEKTIQCRRCGVHLKHGSKLGIHLGAMNHKGSRICDLLAGWFDTTENGYRCQRCGALLTGKYTQKNIHSHLTLNKCATLEFDQTERGLKCRTCGTEWVGSNKLNYKNAKPLISHLQKSGCRAGHKKQQADVPNMKQAEGSKENEPGKEDESGEEDDPGEEDESGDEDKSREEDESGEEDGFVTEHEYEGEV